MVSSGVVGRYCTRLSTPPDPFVIPHPPYDGIERSCWAVLHQAFQFLETGHAPRHVFESRAVGLIVRNVLQTRWRSDNFFYQRRQLVDGHLLVIADVDALSDGCRRLGKAYQSLHYVAYVREATALFACLVDD